jgi:hypothetical protein
MCPLDVSHCWPGVKVQRPDSKLHSFEVHKCSLVRCEDGQCAEPDVCKKNQECYPFKCNEDNKCDSSCPATTKFQHCAVCGYSCTCDGDHNKHFHYCIDKL